MTRVRHRVTVGSAVHESGTGTRLVTAQIDSSLAAPVNACRFVLAPPDGVRASPGDPVQMELGDENGLSPIFSGTADEVDRRIDSVCVAAKGSFHSLVTARFNLLYEKAKAGDVVSDVARRLGVAIAAVESGPEFPAFALGENQTVYEQLMRLARLCGFDLYADAQDKLVFAPYRPISTHIMRYGAEIIAASREERNVGVTGVELYGESPASLGQGPDTSSWFAKKEVKGSSGTGAGIMVRMTDAALRDLNAAGAAAQAVLDRLSKSVSGSLTTPGYPGARLCDAVRISGMPDSALDGTFKITGVRHLVAAVGGFTTVFDWTEA